MDKLGLMEKNFSAWKSRFEKKGLFCMKKPVFEKKGLLCMMESVFKKKRTSLHDEAGFEKNFFSVRRSRFDGKQN